MVVVWVVGVACSVFLLGRVCLASLCVGGFVLFFVCSCLAFVGFA